MSSLLSVEALAVDLQRDDTSHRLVSDASLQLGPGETIALVGESGSGKSLTALAIMGLLPAELVPVAGRIIFEGSDLLHASATTLRSVRGRQIAMVFQEPMTCLNPVKTIGYQLSEGMRLHLNLSRSQCRARAVELLRQVGISDADSRLKQYPHQLSGGMRQRVMIAIALSCRPRLILADEPTTALDVTIQAQILSLLSRLCSEHGVGLVLITHNLGIVARHARRVVVMYGGRVVEAANARRLYHAPRHPYTQGLLRSVPRMSGNTDLQLQPVGGSPPDPFDIIPGCRFHPRCPHATDQCQQHSPVLEQDDDHSVACWQWPHIAMRKPGTAETQADTTASTAHGSSAK